MRLITVIINSILVFCSLILCSQVSVELSPDLDIVNNQVIDKNMKDSDYPLSLQTFLLAINENQEINLNIDVISKRSSFRTENFSSAASLNQHTKYSVKSNNQDIINYYVSEPMYMRGVRIVQVGIEPYYYHENSDQAILYDKMNISINLEDLDFDSASNLKPTSADFNQIISSLAINYNSSSRENNIKPCILFICGGNSLDQSSLQDLIQWRKELGYDVQAVEVSSIGSSAESIRDYIQDAYNDWLNPPEYIVLVGDTGGSYAIPYFSTTWGSSDYDYTLLEGDDLFPEMVVGRISANGSSDLANIINKTLIYEKASYIDFTGTDWYERAALNADPSSSGNSTIITNEYIEELLEQHGFEDVQTNYGAGNYSNWMQNQLSDGILYFNYRGYIGTSGFGSGNINNADNGYMNPFATFITCSTGDFNYTSLSEDFIRAGSVTNPKGAVAAVGTATSSTHTAPNNIVQMGIYDGIFSKNIETAGGSLVNGKITLFNTYIIGASSTVDNFTHWNNLMGDPVLKLWTDTPSQIFPEHPQQINLGTDYIEVLALDGNGNPIENAWITLQKDDWLQSISKHSDDQGRAGFYVEGLEDNNVRLTISKRNHIPYQTNIPIADTQTEIALDDYYIEELSLDSDGAINAGETVELYIQTSSDIPLTQGGFIASASALSSNVEILNPAIEFNLNQSNLIGPFTISANSLVNDELIDIHINISDDWSTNWNYLVTLSAKSANFDIYSLEWVGNNLEPGLDSSLYLEIINNGEKSIDGEAQLSVSCDNGLIDIDNSNQIVYGLDAGEVVGLDPLLFSFSNDIINGSSFSVNISVSSDDFMQLIPFNITVGNISQNDPLGPDEYGYYIYHVHDYGYDLSPEYNWIEIDPNEGGDGVNLQISDGGDGNNISNSTKHIDLPFEFSFYGQAYNEISVSANGWISFGHTNMESFRNYPMPGAGGPSPMIAAFWDDLTTNNQSGVYYLIDEEQESIIVEWSNMRTYNQNSIETFQIILYNAVTPTGDGEIKIQYKEFNNTSSSNNYHPVYSTVGIENHLGDMGLEYTYNNQYPLAANPLSDESALFITTRNTNVYNLGDVNQDESTDIIDIILIVNHILNIQSLSNLGEYLADTNQNSMINILDVILLINIILDR